MEENLKKSLATRETTELPANKSLLLDETLRELQLETTTEVKETKKDRKKAKNAVSLDLNISNDPSYTNLVLPYRVLCRQRYLKNAARIKKQFEREISEHELMQSFALHGVRIHRIFCNPVVDPISHSETIKLTLEEEMNIEKILNTPY